MLEVVIEFGNEQRVALCIRIGFFQFFERGDQRFGDKYATVRAEVAQSIG